MLEGTRNQRNGFFIEAGAYDGVKFSNSLLFEMRYEKMAQVSRVIFSCIPLWNRHDWSGLLVEPNPDAFQNLTEKQRKAWTLPHCFSTKTTPEVIEFDAAGLLGEQAALNDTSAEKDHDQRSRSMIVMFNSENDLYRS